jgi:hypothetical protein
VSVFASSGGTIQRKSLRGTRVHGVGHGDDHSSGLVERRSTWYALAMVARAAPSVAHREYVAESTATASLRNAARNPDVSRAVIASYDDRNAWRGERPTVSKANVRSERASRIRPQRQRRCEAAGPSRCPGYRSSGARCARFTSVHALRTCGSSGQRCNPSTHAAFTNRGCRTSRISAM